MEKQTGGFPLIAAMILAAGSSRRLGRPKQLLRLGGTTLIRKMVQEARDAGLQDVYVVTGGYHEAVAEECADLPCKVIFNADHRQGIGASIRNGLRLVIEERPHLDAVMILNVDQPLVDSIHLRNLLAQYAPGVQAIIPSAYAGTFGVPVVMDRHYFDLLLELHGDRGAKPVIMQHGDKVRAVPFEEAAVDIDTEDDLRALGGSL